MYIQTKEYFSKPEFVASDHYVNFTATISDEGVTTVNGKKIVGQGSVIDTDGKVVTDPLTQTAVGILFHDVDVTTGPQPGAIMKHGFVLEARLPAVAEEVKAKLPLIVFM